MSLTPVPTGSDISLPGGTDDRQASIVALNNGGFVVTWTQRAAVANDTCGDQLRNSANLFNIVVNAPIEHVSDIVDFCPNWRSKYFALTELIQCAISHSIQKSGCDCGHIKQFNENSINAGVSGSLV